MSLICFDGKSGNNAIDMAFGLGSTRGQGEIKVGCACLLSSPQLEFTELAVRATSMDTSEDGTAMHLVAFRHL
jgi:hypothetical protein